MDAILQAAETQAAAEDVVGEPLTALSIKDHIISAEAVCKRGSLEILGFHLDLAKAIEDRGFADEKAQDYYFRLVLAPRIGGLTKRMSYHGTECTPIVQFFGEMLPYFLAWIKEYAHYDLIECIGKIFAKGNWEPLGARSINYDSDREYPIPDSDSSKGLLHYSITDPNSVLIPQLKPLAEQFLELNGLQTIANAITDDPLPTMVNLRALLWAFYNTNWMYRSYHISDYAINLVKRVTQRLISLDVAEIKNEQKAVFSDIMNWMLKIHGRFDEEAEKQNETLTLVFAIKLLTNTTSLEKRRDGLSDIIKVLNDSIHVHPRDRRFADDHLSAPVVMAQIMNAKVVQHLFGEGMHVELVRRAGQVIGPLLCYQKIDADQLATMWDSCVGKHESVAHAVYTLFVDIAYAMTIPQYQMIINKMTQLPARAVDRQLVALLFKIIERAAFSNEYAFQQQLQQHVQVQMSSAGIAEGLTLAWTWAKPDSGVSAEVTEEIVSSISDSFKYAAMMPLAGPYIIHFIECLTRGDMPLYSIRILHAIIASFRQANTSQMDSLKVALTFAIKSHRLLDHMLVDIQRFKRLSTEAFTAAGIPVHEWPQSVVPSATVEPIKYKTHIYERVEKFLMISSHSSGLIGKMSTETFDAFWNAVAGCGPTVLPSDRQCVFAELSKDSILSSVLDDELACHAFRQVFVLDPNWFNDAGMSLFEKLYVRVNNIIGRAAVPKNEKDLIIVTTPDKELAGLDQLWNLALHAVDTAVGKKASQLLTASYINLDADVRQHVPEKRQQFVVAIMDRLTQVAPIVLAARASSAPLPAAELLAVDRSLMLLKAVMDDFNARYGVSSGAAGPALPAGHASSGRGDRMHVKLAFMYNAVAGQPEFDMFSNDTVGELRARAVQYVQQNPKPAIRMIFGGKLMEDDTKLLSQMRFPVDGTTIIQCMVKTPVAGPAAATAAAGASSPLKPLKVPGQGQSVSIDPSKLSPSEADEGLYPTAILSRPEYFDQLFSLLSLPGELEERVWSLIMMLPTNKKMLENMKTLSSSSSSSPMSPPPSPAKLPPSAAAAGSPLRFSDLFDASNTFKLLYSLQIAEMLIVSKDQQWIDSGAQRAWFDRLASTGGLKYLATVLMEWPLPLPGAPTRPKARQSLALLLKIVNLLVQDRLQSAVGDEPSDSLTSRVGFDPNIVSSKLLDIISHVALQPSTSTENSEDVMVASEAMGLFSLCTLQSTEWLRALMLQKAAGSEDESIFGAWLKAILLQCKDSKVRTEIANKLHGLCRSSSASDLGLLIASHYLIPFLDQVETFRFTCADYFALLCSLIELVPSPESSSAMMMMMSPDEEADMARETDTESSLLDKVIAMIISHPIVEPRNPQPEQEDDALNGLMTLAAGLLRRNPHKKLEAGAHLIAEVFTNCLFAIPTAENHGSSAPPKCKSQKTRVCAFGLLVELCRNCDTNLDQLTRLLMPMHVSAPDADMRNTWAYESKNLEKSSTGYVGLKNLGATCYMNSMLQQLFMIPHFRYSLLAVSNPTVSDPSDSLFPEFQSVFGNLQESEKKYVDTTAMVSQYKDFEGQPMNPRQQMDADEFLNNLVDKLDGYLKNTPQQAILKDFFAGGVANQIIGRGSCSHISQREEAFNVLSIEVKNKKNLKEAMELYVQGEVLDGDNQYNCEKCSKKVDALKRVCIQSLPNTLFVHLKRFEFDLDEMRKIKIHDYFEFPMEMDFEPYTLEGLARREREAAAASDSSEASEASGSSSSSSASSSGSSGGGVDSASGSPDPSGASSSAAVPHHPPSYYEYKLSGIIVHMGGADSGHYYSFIKEREPLHGGEQRWLQFNDSIVEVFDPAHIGDNCFGGTEWSTTWNQTLQKSETREVPKIYSAYMLLYERVKPEPVTIPCAVPPLSYLDAGASARPGMSPSDCVPRHIFSKVWEENSRFLSDKNVFDSDYFQFLYNLVQVPNVGASPAVLDYNQSLASSSSSSSAEFHPAARIAELGIRFLVETLAHAKDKSNLGEWGHILSSLLHHHRPMCQWFIQQNMTPSAAHNWSRRLLLLCPNATTRQTYAHLLCQAMSYLLPLERDFLDEKIPSSSALELDMDQEDGGNMEASIFGDSGFTYSSLVLRFMDSLLSHLNDAHHHWRHFSEYFEVMHKFALMGPNERQFLNTRHVILRLLDFFLAEKSPMSPLSYSTVFRLSSTSPVSLSKRIKMGDKFTTPSWANLASTVSVLIRSLRTTAWLLQEDGTYDTKPVESPVIMPSPVDMDVMTLTFLKEVFCAQGDLNGFYRLMYEGADDEAVTNIATHLSWDNKIFTDALDAVFPHAVRALTRDRFPHFFSVFVSVLRINDSLHAYRVHNYVRHFIEVIPHNMKHSPELLLSIQALHEAVKTNESVREVVRSTMVEWIVPLLMTPNFSDVRLETEEMIRDLIPEAKSSIAASILMQVTSSASASASAASDAAATAAISAVNNATMSPLCKEQLQLLFVVLTSKLQSAFEFCKSDSLAKNAALSDVGFGRVSNYLRLLKHACTLDENLNAMVEHMPRLYALWMHMDSLQHENDDNKREFIMLLHDLVSRSQPLLDAWIAMDVRNRIENKCFMSYFIFASADIIYVSYNDSTLPFFYKIVLMMTEREPRVLQRYAGHHNVSWATLMLLLQHREQHPKTAAYLLELFKRSAAASTVLRTTTLPKLFKAAAFKYFGGTVPVEIVLERVRHVLPALLTDGNDLESLVAAGGIPELFSCLAEHLSVAIRTGSEVDEQVVVETIRLLGRVSLHYHSSASSFSAAAPSLVTLSKAYTAIKIVNREEVFLKLSSFLSQQQQQQNDDSAVMMRMYAQAILVDFLMAEKDSSKIAQRAFAELHRIHIKLLRTRAVEEDEEEAYVMRLSSQELQSEQEQDTSAEDEEQQQGASSAAAADLNPLKFSALRRPLELIPAIGEVEDELDVHKPGLNLHAFQEWVASVTAGCNLASDEGLQKARDVLFLTLAYSRVVIIKAINQNAAAYSTAITEDKKAETVESMRKACTLQLISILEGLSLDEPLRSDAVLLQAIEVLLICARHSAIPFGDVIKSLPLLDACFEQLIYKHAGCLSASHPINKKTSANNSDSKALDAFKFYVCILQNTLASEAEMQYQEQWRELVAEMAGLIRTTCSNMVALLNRPVSPSSAADKKNEVMELLVTLSGLCLALSKAIVPISAQAADQFKTHFSTLVGDIHAYFNVVQAGMDELGVKALRNARKVLDTLNEERGAFSPPSGSSSSSATSSPSHPSRRAPMSATASPLVSQSAPGAARTSLPNTGLSNAAGKQPLRHRHESEEAEEEEEEEEEEAETQIVMEEEQASYDAHLRAQAEHNRMAGRHHQQQQQYAGVGVGGFVMSDDMQDEYYDAAEESGVHVSGAFADNEDAEVEVDEEEDYQDLGDDDDEANM